VYGMKTDLHVKHKYLGCPNINKIKITFELL